MGTTLIRLIILVILLTGCASKQTIPPFVEGCLYGTITTYYHLTKQPFPQEYLQSLYLHCEGAQDGTDNSR